MFDFAEVFSKLENLMWYNANRKQIPGVVGMEAEDLVQEQSVALWRACQNFKGDKIEEFLAYAKACMYNTMADAYYTNVAKTKDAVMCDIDDEFLCNLVGTMHEVPVSIFIEEIRNKLSKEIDKRVFELLVEPSVEVLQKALDEAKLKEEQKARGMNVSYTCPVVKQKYIYEVLGITSEQFATALKHIREASAVVLCVRM